MVVRSPWQMVQMPVLTSVYAIASLEDKALSLSMLSTCLQSKGISPSQPRPQATRWQQTKAKTDMSSSHSPTNSTNSGKGRGWMSVNLRVVRNNLQQEIFLCFHEKTLPLHCHCQPITHIPTPADRLLDSRLRTGGHRAFSLLQQETWRTSLCRNPFWDELA